MIRTVSMDVALELWDICFKDVTSEKLYEAIRAAARGEYFMLPR